MAERDVVVVNNGGKLAYIIVGAVIAALVIGAVAYSQGYFDRKETIELKIDLPKVDVN